MTQLYITVQCSLMYGTKLNHYFSACDMQILHCPWVNLKGSVEERKPITSKLKLLVNLNY